MYLAFLTTREYDRKKYLGIYYGNGEQGVYGGLGTPIGKREGLPWRISELEKKVENENEPYKIKDRSAPGKNYWWEIYLITGDSKGKIEKIAVTIPEFQENLKGEIDKIIKEFNDRYNQ